MFNHHFSTQNETKLCYKWGSAQAGLYVVPTDQTQVTFALGQ